MRWQTAKISVSHGSSGLKQILFFFLLLCFLVAFTPGFANQLTDPSHPQREHPWDDPCDGGWNKSFVDPPGTCDFLMLPVGLDLKIIIHMQPAMQKQDLEKRKVYGPSEKNRGHLLIFIR